MERASKLIVVLAAVALLAFDLAIGRAWVGTFWTATALFAIAAFATAVDRRAIAPVLAVACVFPSLVDLGIDTYAAQLNVLWLAPLLGAMMPDALGTPWHLPRRWRAPLVLAAFAVVIGTPLVVLREIDFNPALLRPDAEAVLSGLPRYFAEWSTLVGLTLLVGVLWFDWLLGARELDLARWILVPLGLGLAVMAAAAAYQLFVDITFLNDTAYAALRRATGTMRDGNVCGTLAAVGLGGALALLVEARGPVRAAGATLAFALIVAVWASGSRTALAAAVIVAGWSGGTWWLEQRRSGRTGPAFRLVLVGAGVLLVFGLVVMASGDAIGPLRRMALFRSRNGSFSAMLIELWNRNGFGTAATHLIGRFPWSGIGIGSFQNFGPLLTPVGPLPGDNAQNWYRHQVVELGFLGSLGWLWFSASFGRAVLVPWRRLPWLAQPARSVVVAIGLISLLGMPTQDPVAAIVFWTAAAWYVRLAGFDDDRGGLGARTWTAVAAISLVFGVSTLHAARTELRVPNRTREIGWPYSYGLYAPEPDPEGGVQRWMGRRATALVDVEGAVLRLAVRIPHADIASNPVALQVWCEGQVVLDTRVTSNDPVTALVPVPAGLTRVLIDARVSRTIRPSDFGGADTRELGALVKWEFRP